MTIDGVNMDLNATMQQLKCCVIIPTYNNCKTIKKVIDGVSELVGPNAIIIVNDGATDDTESILNDYKKQLTILTHPKNIGKGKALQYGFNIAFKKGFLNAITIDSDGQHYPTDIPLFLDAAIKNPGALIMGARNMEQDGVPGKSSFGNKFSNFWFKVETGITLPDTQTGFRLYPLAPLSKISLFTSKFETEIEVIVKLAWKKVQFVSIPINVLYDPEERVTHFRPFRDFTRISILNTYLVTLTLLFYLPIRVIQSIKKEAIKAEESNMKKAMSIAFGVFMGIFPIWGFQLLVGIPLSILFRMNKVLFVAAANISLPPAIPFIIYFSYLFGTPFFKDNIQLTSIENITLSAIHLNFMQYVVGAILFALIAAASTFISSFALLNLVRKKK